MVIGNEKHKNVLNPTHKTVFINLKGLEEFLVWKQRN